MELIDELKLALFNLVKLKDHKDEKGKDKFYTEYQPKMWLFAKQVLNKCGDEPLFEETATLPMQNVNGRLTPKVGFVYYIGNYTAPKVFNGLYYECLLTDQRIASHEEIKVETGVKITDWEHDIYKPERFGLRD